MGEHPQWNDLDFARELLKRIVEKRGWSVAEAVEAIVEEYPQIDAKLLTEGKEVG